MMNTISYWILRGLFDMCLAASCWFPNTVAVCWVLASVPLYDTQFQPINPLIMLLYSSDTLTRLWPDTKLPYRTGINHSDLLWDFCVVLLYNTSCICIFIPALWTLLCLLKTVKNECTMWLISMHYIQFLRSVPASEHHIILHRQLHRNPA